MGPALSRPRCCSDSGSATEPLPAPPHRYWDHRHEDILQVSRILASGRLRLLSTKWLLQQPLDWRVQRCQDLPEDAFVPPPLAAVCFSTHYRTLALSYAWLSKAHPDPDGFHWRKLRIVLHLLMAEHGEEDVGVFWDFASLPQPPRQGDEEDCFKEGLRTINFIYGSPDTFVCLQKQMPRAEASDPPTAEPCRPYADRGWCTFEEAVSSMVKPSARVLDLGMIEEGGLELCTKFRSSGKGAPGLTELCTAGRRPPLLPEDMASILARKTFTNRADCEMVARKYKGFFELLCSIAIELAWPLRGGAGWGLDEARQLARCLPRFDACKVLSLREHPWDDACVELIAPALPAMLSLSELWLTGSVPRDSRAHFRSNAMGPNTLVHLMKVLPRLPTLRALGLPGHLRELEESRRLEEQWKALGKPQGASGRPVQSRAEGLYFMD